MKNIKNLSILTFLVFTFALLSSPYYLPTTFSTVLPDTRHKTVMT